MLLIKKAWRGLMGASRSQLLAISPKGLSWCNGLGLWGSREGKKAQGALEDAGAECWEPSGCFCSRRRAFAGGRRTKCLAPSKIPTKMQWLWADLCAVASGEMGQSPVQSCTAACKQPGGCKPAREGQSVSPARRARQLRLRESGCKGRAAARTGVCSQRDSAATSLQPGRGGAGGAHPAGALEPLCSLGSLLNAGTSPRARRISPRMQVGVSCCWVRGWVFRIWLGLVLTVKQQI